MRLCRLRRNGCLRPENRFARLQKPGSAVLLVQVHCKAGATLDEHLAGVNSARHTHFRKPVGAQRITVGTTSGTTLHLDDNIFDSVDQVVFSSSGGTLNSAYASQVAGGDTTHSYIDDLVIA